MKIADVRSRAFAMPLNNPSYPPGPYRFYDRQYFVVEYLTDPTALRAVVPEPLEVSDQSSNLNSSACRIRPALAISPNAAR
jgi:acetoacetate decarboxylase